MAYDVIGDVDDGISMILFEQNGYYKVRAFDENMSKKWERDLKFEKKTAKIVGFVAYQKDFNLFYSFKHKGRTHLRVRKLNNQLKIVDSTLVKLYSKRGFSPDFEVEMSQNKKKTLFFNTDNDSHLEAVVFDNETFEAVRDLRFNPPNFSYREDFLDVLLDNDGGIHVVNERDNKKIKQEKNRLEFISFPHDKDNFKIYNVDFQSQLWYDLELAYDNRNNRILVGGFCSYKTSVEAHSTFFMSINPKNETDTIISIQTFTPEYLTLILGKKIKKNVGFADVTVQEVIPRSDGGLLMIAERNRKQIRTTSGAPTTAYNRNSSGVQTDYYYNEILLFSFNPDGELHWQEILHKKQFSQDDNGVFSSYFLFLNKSNLRLLYNDTVQRGDAVYEYLVNSQGEANRSSLFNASKRKLMLKMSSAIQISGNELLVPSERRSQLRLVKLSF